MSGPFQVEKDSPSVRRPSVFSNLGAIAFCLAILTVFALLARNASAGKSATFDEPASLFSAWVQTHYFDFRCGPENPALFKYVIAAATRSDDLRINRRSPSWDAMLHDMDRGGSLLIDTLYRTAGNDIDRLLYAARCRMIALAVALGGIVAWWAWRWRGPGAAVVAAAAYCLDPNFLGHDPLLKNDVPLALALTGFMASVWLLGERATFIRWAMTSLLLGAAATTKFSGVFALPILVVALIVRAVGPDPWPCLRWTARTRLGRLAVAAAILAAAMIVAYAFIWASYGFRFELSGDPRHPFDPNALTGAISDMRSGQAAPPGYSNSLLVPAQWALRHHVLPEAWIVGFVFIHNWSLSVPAFLCGSFRTQGWWYYFPAAMLFKTPTATLLALILLVVAWSVQPRRVFPSILQNWWPICAVWTVPVMYMAAAMSMHYDVGLRHVFPVYPFLFIILGVGAAKAWQRRPRITAAVAVLLVSGLALETCAAYPDFIPFFNLPAGGWRGGLRLLSDSNLDWGQDLPLVADWQTRHPDRPIFLLYFGTADPSHYAISYYKTSVESRYPDTRQAASNNMILAISATVLQGTYLPSNQRKEMEQFRRKRPLAVLGGSVYLFDAQ
ncbi:MAG: hypothetical protein ABSH08_01125 [Tepidisphaeraceae bacterium]